MPYFRIVSHNKGFLQGNVRNVCCKKLVLHVFGAQGVPGDSGVGAAAGSEGMQELHVENEQ